MKTQIYSSTIWFIKDGKTVIVEPDNTFDHHYFRAVIDLHGAEHAFDYVKEIKKKQQVRCIQTSSKRWFIALHSI